MENDRLRDLRKKMNFTQKDVADKLSISRVAYCRYEKGDRDPDSETIRKIAGIFNCTTDYLLGRTDFPAAQLTPEEAAFLRKFRDADVRTRRQAAAILDIAAEGKKDE